MSGEHILIIDDDPIIRAFTRNMLEEREYRVTVAADGERGLELARTEEPDLVLTDLVMPYADGFDVLRKMKSDPDLREIPVIVLSMKDKERDIVRGLELGAEDYVVKPFHALELLARISKALERRRGAASPDSARDQ